MGFCKDITGVSRSVEYSGILSRRYQAFARQGCYAAAYWSNPEDRTDRLSRKIGNQPPKSRLRNTQEERTPQIHRGGSLRALKIVSVSEVTYCAR